MTLRRMVSDMILDAGSGTADTLYPELAVYGFTRKQIKQALGNARRIGAIESDGTRLRGILAVYYPPKSAFTQIAATLAPETPMLSSVWDMANPKTTWPQPPAVRTIHAPLGPWNSEEAA